MFNEIYIFVMNGYCFGIGLLGCCFVFFGDCFVGDFDVELLFVVYNVLNVYVLVVSVYCMKF